MGAGDIRFLTFHKKKSFREVGEAIRLRCPEFLSQLENNDETEVDWSSFSSSIGDSKSFEWERVIIIDKQVAGYLTQVSKIEFRRPKVIGNRLKP